MRFVLPLLLVVAACQKDPKPETSAPAPAPAAPAAEAPAPEPAPPAELLAEGAPAPALDAVAHDGTHVTLASLAGKPAVVYFYPKDETPG